ncbi:MAG: hypothetical protein M2R45_01093 [Verrucomicrobia subdivision 3 bacterium]|nr:hypothetical protein [Limisphaerales bacterium]MCS1414204.1 hypothetical protein [Limisphaerales bacterium]
MAAKALSRGGRMELRLELTNKKLDILRIQTWESFYGVAEKLICIADRGANWWGIIRHIIL